MSTQGNPHVVNLHGNGVPSKQTLMQKLDPRALDKTQFQQSTLQFEGVVIIQTGIAYLDDDALVAWPGEAEFAGLGHDARDYRRDRPRLLTVIIRCD
jgi:hypothetical protein